MGNYEVEWWFLGTIGICGLIAAVMMRSFDSGWGDAVALSAPGAVGALVISLFEARWGKPYRRIDDQ